MKFLTTQDHRTSCGHSTRAQLRKAPGRQLQAYTLAELLVAVAILAIMFASLYSGIRYGFSITDASRQDLRATQILLERMEGIRLFNWNQLVDTNKNPVTFTKYYYPMATNGQSQGIAYQGTLTVTAPGLDPPATYSNVMKKVTVTLNWTSGSLQHTRSLSTYAAKNGLQNYIYSN
jgi:prepilin-type N-terminal cleavage/methylation domain-containing protein